MIVATISCNQQTVLQQGKNGNLLVAEKSITNQVPQSEIKLKNWEPIFFEIINNKLKKINLPLLNTKEIAGKDLEVRMWVGFGESSSRDIKGIILEKKQDQWTCLYLPQDTTGKNVIQNKNPKSGWNKLWNNLVNYGFLTLPDITESKDNIFDDATCIVVEIKDSEQYRNYMQIKDTNLEKYPELRSPESIKLKKACKFLTKEFNIPLCL